MVSLNCWFCFCLSVTEYSGLAKTCCISSYTYKHKHGFSLGKVDKYNYFHRVDFDLKDDPIEGRGLSSRPVSRGPLLFSEDSFISTIPSPLFLVIVHPS